jgi:hypothetical protein
MYFFFKQQSTKQYTEGQTIQWPKEKVHTTIYKAIHRRTDNTMAKRRRTGNTMADRKRTYNNLQNNTQKDRQYNGLLYVLFLSAIVLFVLLCIAL